MTDVIVYKSQMLLREGGSQNGRQKGRRRERERDRGDMYDHARLGETKMEMEMADGSAHGVQLDGHTYAGFFMISVGPSRWGTT